MGIHDEDKLRSFNVENLCATVTMRRCKDSFTLMAWNHLSLSQQANNVRKSEKKFEKSGIDFGALKFMQGFKDGFGFQNLKVLRTGM